MKDKANFEEEDREAVKIPRNITTNFELSSQEDDSEDQWANEGGRL